MWLKITEAIYKAIIGRMHEMCLQGAFPEVKYSKADGWGTYSMIDHSVTYSKMAKFVDKKIKEKGLDEQLGVYTRKHSGSFMAELKKILDDIVEADIINQVDRFKTMWD